MSFTRVALSAAAASTDIGGEDEDDNRLPDEQQLDLGPVLKGVCAAPSRENDQGHAHVTLYLRHQSRSAREGHVLHNSDSDLSVMFQMLGSCASRTS
mmetsp:Transcript_30048/g.55856  ORF Transcript_30048/g.55856 Transcript_30048/m.55856 type:complete len:97 (-) Transcript_30048:164-454(-)